MAEIIKDIEELDEKISEKYTDLSNLTTTGSSLLLGAFLDPNLSNITNTREESANLEHAIEMSSHEENTTGDFCNVIERDDGKVVFYMGDAAGHNIMSHFYAKMLNHFMNQIAKNEEDISTKKMADLITIYNNMIYNNKEKIEDYLHKTYGPFLTDTKKTQKNPEGKLKHHFIDCFSALFGIYDKTRERLSLTNAGHTPLMHIPDTSDDKANFLYSTDILPSANPGIPYHELPVPIKTDGKNLIVCYTDGLTDQKDPEGISYEQQRLLRSVQRAAKKPVAEITKAVLHDVNNYRNNQEQTDDQTVLAIKIK